MNALIRITLALAVFLDAFFAQAAGSHADHATAMQAKSSAEMQMVEGLVKKVDRATGNVTLSHGALTNLNMPAMTMAFRVSNLDWLDQMKSGDKIRFMADHVNGAITVVHFEAAK